MALTPSTMLPLSTKAPEFNLPDTVSQKNYCLSDIKGENATVIMFISNHCPFVKHVISKISEIAKLYKNQGVGFVAISSNDVVNYPDDAPQHMKTTAEKNAFTFPYLYDETQEIAKNYNAACTPDFYVFDSELKLAYRGQLDDSRPGNNIPVTGKDLTTALDALINKTALPRKQKPSIGCNIKWK